MPSLPKKPCSFPDCPELVDKGEKYCEEHKNTKPKRPCKEEKCPEYAVEGYNYCEQHLKQRYNEYKRIYDQKRASASKRGYNANWSKVRKMYLNRNPLCECDECKRLNRIRPAKIVHHIDENPRNNKEDNLMAVTRECHNRIHGLGGKG